MFCFFPASFISSTYTDKNSPFPGFANKHSQCGTFPNRVLLELFQMVFPTVVLPEGDRTDFAREEQPVFLNVGPRFWPLVSW